MRALTTFAACGIVALLLAGAFGCSKKPLLYPNAHLNSVGAGQADADIADCTRLAKEYGATGGGAGHVAGSTAVGAGVGAAAGAAGGAVVGAAGRGAAAGGVGGATAGLLTGLLTTDSPAPATRAFVDRCLQERGYEPMGWK